MRKRTNRLEELLIDITFAEEREFSPAKEALSKIAETIEDTFIAIAFAEAGEFGAATCNINKKGEGQRPQKTNGQFTTLCTGRA